ncbi:FAD-binding domain-containing protein [Diplogelasinospora grovesii]|uniref:FAD-binding domain-containing protein n=1 Tax=Diplogelasinospora grovesii TaxID=303347 RepID=A0AAN6N417_9PEZI|nr:FAD-binding domain-containing protein [Diplogelasinospora grovesii]
MTSHVKWHTLPHVIPRDTNLHLSLACPKVPIGSCRYPRLSAQVRGTRAAAPSCKAVPGSDAWPSLEIWSQLNQSLDGRLLHPTPPGAVCHPGHDSYNAAECPSLQTSWFSEFFHTNDPVSAEWNNWNNDTCLPDPRAPCSSVGYPVYVVNATTPQHVKTGINFARAHNIRLIVKNSGHDYVGRSSASNALSIWVHHMRGIQFHESSFSPQGCNLTIAGAAITAAAGTQMLEAYRATALHNQTVVGGNGRTVALGGFITGAGHSILSPHYGMAADQVLEMEIVTPTGNILTLNECQNTDLFWAMRGGGGSTFGVMTSVTLKTIPSLEVMSLDFQFSTAADNPLAFNAIAYFVSQFPYLADSGVSGYPIIFKSSPDPTTASGRLVSGMIGKLVMLDTRNASDVLTRLDPLFAHVNSTFGEFIFTSNATYYHSFGAWYEENFDPSPAGYESVMGSRLLDQQALTANITATKIALEKFAAGGQATVYIVSGKGVHNAQPRGGSTAANPAWRRTYVHATASVAFAPLNATAKTAAIAATDRFAAALRELSPNTGAYVNEANRYEPDWQATFWGDNYPRLLQIKRTVDPDDVLWCMPCVGNERWEEVDDLLCRVD